MVCTLIGASQFTVQVSGKTIYLPDMNVLPVHNVPVAHFGLAIPDRIDSDAIAAAFGKMRILGIPDERDQSFRHRDQSFQRNVTAHSGRT